MEKAQQHSTGLRCCALSSHASNRNWMTCCAVKPCTRVPTRRCRAAGRGDGDAAGGPQALDRRGRINSDKERLNQCGVFRKATVRAERNQVVRSWECCTSGE